MAATTLSFFAVLLLSVSSLASELYTVQLGSYESQAQAAAAIHEYIQLPQKPFLTSVEIPGKGMRWRLNSGSFGNRAAAQAYRSEQTSQNKIKSGAIIASYKESAVWQGDGADKKQDVPAAAAPVLHVEATQTHAAHHTVAPAAPKQETVASPARSESSAVTFEGVSLSRKEAQIIVKADGACFTVSLQRGGQDLLSCNSTTQLEYTQRKCTGFEVLESANVEGEVTCNKSNLFNLKFKTSKGVVSTQLAVQRKSEGKIGTVIVYTPVESNFSQPESHLKDPILRPVDGALPDTAPVQVKVSGFSAVEFEQSSNFGYDVGTTSSAAVTNFDASATGSKRQNYNFLSDIQFDIS